MYSSFFNKKGAWVRGHEAWEKRFVLICLLCFFIMFSIVFSFRFVYAKELGTVGVTYKIVEKDALKEIEERVRDLDMSQYTNQLREKIRHFKPGDIQKLPYAKVDRTFTVDMTYTLNFDIPDGKGGILYPRGYTFNPLDYINLSVTMVVIDGTDRKQINWFQSTNHFKDEKVILLITDGSYYELIETLKRPVYYTNSVIIGRFQLKAVPSVISRDGKYMRVTEYAVKKNSH